MERKVLASPLARKLAMSKQININDVIGSSELGRISTKDVLKHILNLNLKTKNGVKENVETKVDSFVAPRRSELLGKTVPLSTARKTIAKVMMNSQSNVAYVSLLFECDATKLWDYRKQVMAKILKEEGVKLTFLPLIMRAFALAIEEFPIFGAKLSKDGASLVYPNVDSINITIAVDTEHGLMVPVIKEVNNRSLVDVQRDVINLATKAREKKISLADMSGGVFTISNFGSIGAVTGTPVINYPELAITGVGVIKDHLFVRGGGIFQAGKLLPITIAADHRWIDGADIGRFAKRVIAYLEEPSTMGGV